MSLVVSKFGGTSMGNAECMLRSAEISVQQKSFLICVSATSGTTNQLIALGQTAEKGDSNQVQKLAAELIAKHQTIAKDLGLPPDHAPLAQLFEEMLSIAKGMQLLKDCSPRALDILLSLGERTSSVLFAQAMKTQLAKAGVKKEVVLLDARDVIVTDDHFGSARPQIAKIAELAQSQVLNKYPEDKYVIVTQGYIGRSLSGNSTTLGRGGGNCDNGSPYL